MNEKISIAIIGSGEMAVTLVENAKKMGFISHTFSNDMTDKAVGLSDYHHNVSIFEVGEIVNICKDIGAKGVLPTTELTISVAANVAKELGLHGMPVDVSQKITDKGYVRECAVSVESIHQPNYLIWNRGEEVPCINDFPVIVKPTAMGGKRGVTVAYSQEDLISALEYAVDNMPAHKTRVIIEEFLVGGTEFSVESLSFEGEHKVIQVTEKITSGPPHCVELGHIQPARISREIRKNIEVAIPKLLEKCGIDNTTSHTEIKVIEDKIYLIELNARSGGDHISYPLTELSTGYPYLQGAIKIAIGNYEHPIIDVCENHCCGVIFVAKQTKQFLELFNKCEEYSWLYKKNISSDELIEIINNHSFDTNYFIFCSDKDVPTEISSLLN